MQQPLSRIALRRSALVPACLAVACLVVACREPTDAARADGACRQTYEFNNSGCFEVRGQVVGAGGQGIAGIYVGPRPVSTRGGFNTAYTTTDAAGQFRIRLSRMFGSAPAAGQPDTLSVHVVAFDPRSAGVGIPARVRDSVLTIVTVAPVGATPTPVDVRIVLTAP